MKPLRYRFFTANEVKPQGWLRDQLRREADGLAGNLDKIWPDVRDSAWIGGNREGWERVPYWLDGFIPLAFLLDDADMQQRASRYINGILDRQQPDGWICPCGDAERHSYDPWAILLICKVLSLWCDCTGDRRAQDALERCLLLLNSHLNHSPLHAWGEARWFEGLIPIFWLYERTEDARLLTLAKKLRVQGFDWPNAYDSGLIGECTEGWDHFSHIVNTGMMLKSEALYARIGEDTGFAERAWQWLERNHGTAAGIFNGDECLSGTSPVHGSELCGVVELMYSCEQLFSLTGDPIWLDRLERAGFNALPASVSPDMWTHQYDQLANQISCVPTEKSHFRTNGKESHVFGLEPNYGCCTANFGQGFPKMALSAFMRAPDGIALCMPVPASLRTTVNGNPVEIVCKSGYPFRDRAILHVRCEQPTEFTLYLRIPGFADAATVCSQAAAPGQLYAIRKTWNCDTLEMSMTFRTELVPRSEGLYAVVRGPLVFSLPIQAEWEKIEYTRNDVDRFFPYCDYYLHPKSAWNYGFTSDAFEAEEHPITDPFDPSTPAISLHADLREVAWGSDDGVCERLPDISQPGQLCRRDLIPYGAAKLRMTEMPKLFE
jgi:hypothetical protein